MNKNKGFTLAEVLIVLTVIGIVAAISIPSLISNVNERAWNTQRKALHVRFTSAIMDMPKLKGFGKYEETENEETGKMEVTADTASESFLVEGLSKVYKIKNICNKDNIEKCGIPSNFTTFNGDKIDFPKNWNSIRYCNNCDLTRSVSAAAFQTTNGESVAVFYNPNCTPLPTGATTSYSTSRTCANFIYDLNGLTGPNQIGKDMGFITALYSDQLDVVAPMVNSVWVSGSTTGDKVSSSCSKGLRPATMNELAAISMNTRFINNNSGSSQDYLNSQVWSSNQISAGPNGKSWYANIGNQNMSVNNNAAKYNVYCIKE